MNQVEFMAALTTNRFQSVNEMKLMKESLLHELANMNMKSINGTNTNHTSIENGFMNYSSNNNNNNNDNNNSVSKAIVEDFKNEMFTTNFKVNLDMRKLETDLRTTQKDLSQAKVYH